MISEFEILKKGSLNSQLSAMEIVDEMQYATL